MSDRESTESAKQLAADLEALRAELATTRAALDETAAQEATEARRAQALLQESAERLHLAVKAARMGIWDWDILNDRVTFSEELLHLRGLSPSNAPHNFQAVVASVDPTDRERFQETVRAALEHEAEFALEFRVRRPDGQQYWSASRALVHRDERGRPVRMIGVSRDVTERKRAEAALAASEARYRGLVELSPDAIFIIRHEKIRFANRAGLLLLRASVPEEILGHSPFEFLPVEFHEQTRRRIQGILELGQRAPLIEERLLRLDGTLVDVEVTSAPVADEGVTAIQVVVRDISERKVAEAERRRAEEEVRRLNAELETRVLDRTAQLQAANAELEAFSSSVSHDLRAPLGQIIGFATLLHTNGEQPLSPERTRQLEIILEAARRMNVLIEDLLSFSRMSRLELQHTKIALDLIVEEARRELRPEEAGRKVTWKIEPLPELECDPAMLRIVFVNLLSNALKYSRTREEARIEVGCRPDESGWTFFVRDNGVGFDMRYAHKLFGVFQRLHREEEFPGTGIGLATVRRIIHRHGGRTWAESKPGEGATFYFTLPKIGSSPGESASHERPARSLARERRGKA